MLSSLIMNQIKLGTICFVWYLLPMSMMAQSANKENPSVEYYYHAWQDMASLDHERAQRIFSKSIKSQPYMLYGYYGRAENELQSDDLAAAEVDIDSALAKASIEPEVYDLAGKIYLANQDLPKAKAYFLKSLALEPSSEAWIDLADTYTNLGSCYLQLEENDSAFWYFNKSIDLKAHNPNAHYFLGLYYMLEDAKTKACYYLALSAIQGTRIPDNLRAYCQNTPIAELDTIGLAKAKLQTEIYTDTVYINRWGRWTSKESADYARVTTFNIHSFRFEDSFNDYDLLGNLIFSGEYDEAGRLTRLFNAYYTDGQLMASGLFGNGKRMGIWEYYDSLGHITHKVKYLDGDLEIIEAYDEQGNPTLKGGNGTFAFIDRLNKFYKMEITGEYNKGEKAGTWRWYDEHGELRREEVYKKGRFIEARDIGKSSRVPTTSSDG